LERGTQRAPGGSRATSPQLPLFSAEPSALERALDALAPDALSPREALDALYQLKALRAP
jgi:DNA mismatch repair protein MutS